MEGDLGDGCHHKDEINRQNSDSKQETQANEDNKPYNRKLKSEKQNIPDESSKQAENKDLKDEEDTDLQSQTKVNQNASDMDESQAQQMSTSKSQELVVYKYHDKNEPLGFHEKLRLDLIGTTAVIVILLLLVFRLMIKVNTLENNVQEIRSTFEDFRKDMKILSYESLNSFLRENYIKQDSIDANGSLVINTNQNVYENYIVNLANTISRLDKKVPEIRNFEFILNSNWNENMIGRLQALAPIKMQTFSFGSYYINGVDYALSLISRVTHTFSIKNSNLDKKRLEAIFKNSSHLQNLEIIDCSFQDLIDLDFEAGSPYSIKILKISIHTPDVVDLIDEIAKAISKCSLKNSLKQIKVNSSRNNYKLWNMILAQHGLSHIEVILST